jgi:peptide subunit release factor 1 (eRF1)
MKLSYILISTSKNTWLLKELKQELEIFRIRGFKQWYVIYLPEDGDASKYNFIKDKKIVQTILENL